MSRRGRQSSTSSRSERGTGLVEFAIVAVLFFSVLFGIVSFGVLLSFKQNMTQAASESARASIAVVDDPDTDTVDERKEVAVSSMEAAVTEFNRECSVNVECLVTIHECVDEADFSGLQGAHRTVMVQPVQPPATEPGDACLTTRIEYENRGSDRILPPFPIIASFEPDRFASQTTVHLVPVPDISA